MPVTVRGYLTYKEIIGEQSIPIGDGETLTLLGLLTRLETQIGNQLIDPILDPETGLPGDHVAIILNGRSYRNLPEGLDTLLQEGDEVSVFPPMAGGT
jgi:molybdopterin synthase sulfur carrier subunit